MAGTRINEKGPVAEANRSGTQIDSHVSSSGFMPFPVQQTYTHVLSSTGSGGFCAVPGVNIISGAFVNTVQMPALSVGAGAMFTFRAASNHQHVLTCSADAAGTLGFVGSDGVTSGSRFTMNQGTVGTAAVFIGDGRRWWFVTGHTGSVAGT